MSIKTNLSLGSLEQLRRNFERALDSPGAAAVIIIDDERSNDEEVSGVFHKICIDCLLDFVTPFVEEADALGLLSEGSDE